MGYFSDLNTASEIQSHFNNSAKESSLWASDAVERTLAHIEGNEVRRVYVRGEYWYDRARMADWWAGEQHRFQLDGMNL